MPTNTLSDARCKAARPAEKAYKLFDGGGLFLYVSPTGSRTWRMAYRVAGKPQTMSFGPYPEVSLAEARERRDAEKAKLRSGEDPMAARRVMRRGISLAEANEAYWAGRKDLTDAYRENARRGIEMHLGPRLGNRILASITRDDLLGELQRMDAAGKHSYVRKVRMWSSQLFEWGMENSYCTINPAAMIRPEKAFSKAPVEHFAALELAEVPGLIQRLAMEGELQSVLACLMLAYTWVRTVELRKMEPEEIDWDEAIWRIPGRKMKRKKDHLVPLPRQAMEILRKMKARSPGSRFVFPCDRRNDRSMSENAILYLLHRIGYKGNMTGHGWRTVASTWANENGYKPDAIERQLAHSPEDKVRAAYNRAEYLPERREMLQAWADWLDSCNVDPGRPQG